MDFKRLNTPEDVASHVERLNASGLPVVLDVETTDKDARKAVLLDVQLSSDNDSAAVIFPAEFAYYLNLLDRRITLVAHNYKYDAHVLYRHGIDLLDRNWRDTLLLGHLLDENRDSYSLDSYVKEYWNDPYKEEFWAKYKTYQEASEEDKIDYACRDIVYTGYLYKSFIRQAVQDSIPGSLITHAHRLQSSLLRTEIEGIRVDTEYLENLGIELKRKIDELRPRMRSLVADEIDLIELELWQKEIEEYKTSKRRQQVERPTFNFESTGQLQNLLYGRLKLPVQKNEKTRSISTDYQSLEKLKNHHPVVGLIQENRELQKVYTAYVEGTIDRLDQNRVYPNFRVAGTVTGRLAHSSPNLAQLPKSGGVRGIYAPDQGRVLISADYSQLEVVVEAHLTGDKSLIRMLENGESKHDLTARELGCSRDVAKTLNFCLQYWGTHFKVAKLLNCSVNEALGIWNRYWEIYSGPKKLKAETDRMVNEGIPIKTAFGRKRRFAFKKRTEWDGDYRQAYNFLIQSTGADITSRAFYLISDSLLNMGFGRALFTVHDEILIDAKPEVSQDAERILIDTMEGVGKEFLTVPLKAESSGPMIRWED